MMSSLTGVVMALFLAFVTVAFAAPAMEKLYGALLAPITTVRRSENEQLDVPLFQGLFWLFAVYFLTGLIFAFTGGAAGFVGSDAFKTIGFKAEAGIQWGFLAGILFAGFGRIRGSMASNGLVDFLSALTVMTIGACVFLLIADDWVLRSVSFQYIRDNLFYAPLCALIATGLAAGIVELIIYLRERIGRPLSREVPRSGVRYRAEQHEMVEQVFWPHNVQTRTDQIIGGTIREGGIRSICWMTNTAPRSHCDAIREAALAWAAAHSKTGNHQAIAESLIKANLRLIVPSKEVYEEVKSAIPWMRRARITRCRFRSRLLIINGKVAITHLPIPYHGDITEQSNFAAISRNIETVHELEAVFDNIWESMHCDYVQKKLTEALVCGDRLLPTVLLVICEHSHGISAADILANVGARQHACDKKSLDTCLETLVSKKLVTIDPRRQTYHLARRRNLGEVIDAITRLSYRHTVVDFPLQ
jgi:hypothetical protein